MLETWTKCIYTSRFSQDLLKMSGTIKQ